MNKSRKLLKELRNKMTVKQDSIHMSFSGIDLLDWIARVDKLLKPVKKS